MPPAPPSPASGPRPIAAIMPEVLARYGLSLPLQWSDPAARKLPPGPAPVLAPALLAAACSSR